MRNNSGKRSRISRRTLIAASAAAGCALAGASAGARKGEIGARTKRKIDLERFIDDCIAANRESDRQAAVREVLRRGVSDPGAMLAAIGEPNCAGITTLHRSKTLTIFSAVWTPRMPLMPHNHLMWAIIGIYSGREDNMMWRRNDKSIEAFGAKALFEGEVAALSDDVIHSVANPLERFTGGIHIYGGDFFDTTRSQWNPETLAEEPSDGAVIQAIFERENDRFGCDDRP